MTNNPVSQDPATAVTALLSTPPPVIDGGFSAKVMQQAQQQWRLRKYFLTGVWLLALTGLLMTLQSMGVDSTLAAFLRQTESIVPELKLISDLNISELNLSAMTNIQTGVSAMLHNTGLLTLAAGLLLGAVFACTSLLD